LRLARHHDADCLASRNATSELTGLQWQCVDFLNNRIVVNKRWALGEFGRPKTECSDASVSMGEALATVLSAWRQQTPYCQPTDFVFASFKSDGAVPLAMSCFVADHLRSAAIEAGVKIEKANVLVCTIYGIRFLTGW
jgi:integrase